MPEDRMGKWFPYDHLPEKIQATSKQFYDLYTWIVNNLESGLERTVTERKLLEAKDAGVRATLHPGG